LFFCCKKNCLVAIGEHPSLRYEKACPLKRNTTEGTKIDLNINVG
jgi:hypothetical protein